jgi:hypothetical protein
MIISVINHTPIPDAKVQEAIRAVNRQIAGDFAPYWSMAATLRLEGKSAGVPETRDLRDMRGDGVLYLWDGKDPFSALGFHEANHRGIPYGFVFTQLSKSLHERWTTSLSHEALEMIADPECNLLVRGPHPSKRASYVFHYYEMCDAVQNDTYTIDGVTVSNFVLPLYFTGQDEVGARNDFLSTTHRDKKTRKPATLRSFGINPGGYVGFFNPESGEDEMATLGGDKRALRCLEQKRAYGGGRRMVRYRRFTATAQALETPVFVPVPEGVRIIRSENA